MNRAQEKFREVFSQFRTGMLVTRAPNGLLQGRPMEIAQKTGEAELRFITSLESEKAHEIALEPAVTVTFQAERRYLSISGHATVESDEERARQLWTNVWAPWFPAGPADPTLVFIHLKPSRAEYWDRAGDNQLKFAFEAARAVVAGNEPRESVERHGAVQF